MPNNRDGEWSAQLTQLVSAHQTAVRRMCFFLLRDADAAQDAVQDTFLKAYKALPRYRGECSEKSWLMRIAINICRDMMRSRWHRHMDRRITPEELPLAKEAVDAEALTLRQAIRRLPRELMEAVLLYYYQDMTLQETAKCLGIAASTVSKRLNRARKLLRNDLERGEQDDA